MEFKDPKLLKQEIPLHSSSSQRPPQEISVVEATVPIESSESLTFPEAGGGVTVEFADSVRSICWRTQGNSLELFEFSLDVDLYSSHFVITFEGSKILPGVCITLVKNQLHISCCTIHALHDIVLDLPSKIRQGPKPGISNPSLLCELPSFDFEKESWNCYFSEQTQSYATNWTAETVMAKGQYGGYLVAALTTNQGNMLLIKMMAKSEPTVATINRASRMSRLWSGINPWAEAGGPDTISDLKIIVEERQAFVAAACKDHKLRVWSFETHDILLNYDLSPHVQDDPDSSKRDIKIRSCNETRVVSVCSTTADHAEFLQVKLEMDTDSNTVTAQLFSPVSAPLTTSTMPYRHLVDYTLSTANILTVLWRDVEEVEFVMLCDAEVGIWHDVAPHPPPAPEIPLFPYQDVRESYMGYIFMPGRFSPIALARTLSINRRSTSSAVAAAGQQELKERVATHIQNEIQEMTPDEDVDDDSLQVMAWSGFYQNLIQYQQVVSRSLGLTITHGTNFTSIVKKGYSSLLMPVSALEAACRGSDLDVFRGVLQPEECDADGLKSLATLLECLGSLHNFLGAEFLDSIQQNLCLPGNSPTEIMEGMMPEILDAVRESGGDNALENLVTGIDDVTSSVKILLMCLEPLDLGLDFDVPDEQSWPAGTQGVEVISRCVMKHIENRFQLSILLYITVSILENPRRQDNIHTQEEDYTEIPSRVVRYIQTYQAMFWLSATQTQNISQATLESTMQTLSVHDPNISVIQGRSRASSNRVPLGNLTVLEFFVSAEGGKLLQAFLKTQNGTSATSLHEGIVTNIVHFLVYLIWPSGPTLTLPDFLLTHGHYATLQRYLQRELGGWCNWCPKSCAYMLAHCHLHHGNFDKAVRSFILASSGIGIEDYLMTKLLKEDEDNLHPVAQEIIYFTKVLPIFERMDLPEQVITLARHAIQIAKTHEQDPNLPILWSSVFRQSNNLSRHCEALKAIILNPDPDHRKDCLRTLTVSLCERKKYKTLVEFQYGDLEEDLVGILEHRARGTDLATAMHNYYDLLYAFHIQRGNFRKAASAMYEQGYRIGCEFSPSSSTTNIACLQKQLDCYSACINCLHLVADDNRWILHPVGNRVTLASRQPQGGRSPKRQSDGEVVDRMRSKVIVHEIADIQKEALLVEMKLKLEEVSTDAPTTLGPLVSAAEISAFLCHAGLYDDAITISSKFEIPFTSIFASLASKCVRLSYADDQAMADGWGWLQENETAKAHCVGGKSSTSNWTAADTAYRLLQVYLEKYGDQELQGTRYYHAVAKSLLGLSAALPAWFVNAYKDRNYPELLRLLVCFDRLEEATSLAVELINSMKINISTSFDESGLQRSVWAPYTVIEQLLCILEDMRSQQQFEDLYHSLNDSMEEYLHIAETTSDDMVQVSMQRAAIAMRS